MEAVSNRVEDNCTGPNGLQLLHHQRVSQELLGLSANRNLQRRNARMLLPLTSPECAVSRCFEALKRVKVVAQRIDQLPSGELFQQTHSQQLAEERPRLANAHIARICLSFLPKLEAIRYQAVQSATVVVLSTDLLLDRLDQKLRDLWRAQLVPAECCLAALYNGCTYSVGVVVYGNAI